MRWLRELWNLAKEAYREVFPLRRGVTLDLVPIKDLGTASQALKDFYLTALREAISQDTDSLWGVWKGTKVWAFPGATKWQRADGTTWIEKHWRTADVALGSGNRTKRRMGMICHTDLSGVCHWQYPKRRAAA